MNVLTARYVVARGDALARAWRDSGLSIDALARLALVSPPAMQRAIEGQPVWGRTAYRIAKALEREVDDLFEVAP